MRMLFDAQLPRRLAMRLQELGHDVVHTLDLPRANRTTDRELIEIAERQNRIVVTKDGDFVVSHLINSQPANLLLISTGNIDNATLGRLMRAGPSQTSVPCTQAAVSAPVVSTATAVRTSDDCFASATSAPAWVNRPYMNKTVAMSRAVNVADRPIVPILHADPIDGWIDGMPLGGFGT